jgi:hypothetical protein
MTFDKTNWLKIIGLGLLGAILGGALYIGVAWLTERFFSFIAMLAGVFVGGLASLKLELNPKDTKKATIILFFIGMFGVIFGYILPCIIYGFPILLFLKLVGFNFMDFMFIIIGGIMASSVFAQIIKKKYGNSTKPVKIKRSLWDAD